MELNNDFRVGVDRSTAWKALTDLERIAPLLPGAQLQEVEGDEYRGIVKVKVGPIQAQYKGTATLVETDESAGRMVMRASGRDTRGQGNASATITVTVADDAGGTKVSANTDLTISGKVAQFGRGVLADVSSKLIGQFAENLEKELSSSGSPLVGGASTDRTSQPEKAESNGAVTPPDGDVGPGTTAPTTTSATTTSSRTPEEGAPPAATHAPTTGSGGSRKIDSPEPEPVDLFDAAGHPMIKRLLPIAGGAAVVVVVLLVLRRRRKRTRAQQALAALRARTPDLDTDDLKDAGRWVAGTAATVTKTATKQSRRAAKRARKQAESTAKSTAKDARKAAEKAAKRGRKLAAQAAAEGRKRAEKAQAETTKRAKKAKAETTKRAKKAQAKAAKRAQKAQAEAAKRASRARAKAAVKAAKKGGQATLEASGEALRNGAQASTEGARSLAASH